MLQRLVDRLPRGQFARRLATLSGGTFIGQATLVLVSPLLTRLFTPADFGLFAVFQALTGMFGVIMALRYEYAVPIVRDEHEALDLVVLSALATVLMSLLATAAVAVGGGALAEMTDSPGLVILLWLLPPVLLAIGLGQPFDYLSIRHATFRINGSGRIAQFGSQAAAQLGFGILSAGAVGLVLGYGLGYILRLGVFLVLLTSETRRGLRAVRWRDLWPLAKRHWRYPLYASPSTLLQGAGQLLPTILVAIIYGPILAGWFGLAQRIMVMPVRLLAQAASQVFLGAAAPLTTGRLYELFVKTALRFLAVGFLGVLPVLLFGPALFGLVFGEAWTTAGRIAQILAPLQLVRFVVMPISQTLNIFGRQDVDFAASVLGGIVVAVSFGVGWGLTLDALTTLALYSAGMTFVQVILFAAAWRLARARSVAVKTS